MPRDICNGTGSAAPCCINVRSDWTYHGPFFFRFPTAPATPISSTLTIGFQSAAGAAVAATSQAFTLSSAWQQITFRAAPSSTPASIANLFTIQVNGAAVAGHTIEFAMLTCFPPTFVNRIDGMRLDLSELAFFRFPGGNNLEGGSTAARWQWRNTLGALVDHPGRYTLGGVSVAAGDLTPYIHDAIDQINFAIGDASTNAMAAIRASMGHPAHFTLKYVEIGNEYFVANGVSSANKRGEYAAIDNDARTRLTCPTIDGAVAEAAYMTGFGRNSDIVFAASYAPLLNHVSSTQWVSSFLHPSLCTRHQTTFNRRVVCLQKAETDKDGYHQMFSLYKSDTYLTSTINTAASETINTATTANTIVFTLPFTILYTAGTGTVLTAPTGTQNMPASPSAAVPKSFSFTAGKTITDVAPGLSVSVLIVSTY
ncbi:hypothetical protein C8R44DRAFT_834399 [Mycena epipterygia]|nr:hypothetical protein C8R44DRAFT_834399 [Mycena epipterygia]